MPFTPLKDDAKQMQPRGFVPSAPETEQPKRGFTPLAPSGEFKAANQRAARAQMSHPTTPSAERPDFSGAVKTMQAIGQVYPVAETAANLATQAVALPAAGLAGIGAAATKAVGLTDADPGDVVHKVTGAMTYQPRTELGQHLTEATFYPLTKLQEGSQAAGDAAYEATDSPAVGAATRTLIEGVLPLAVAPAAKAMDKVFKPLKTGEQPAQDAAGATNPAPDVQPIAPQPSKPMETQNAGSIPEGKNGVAHDAAPLVEGPAAGVSRALEPSHEVPDAPGRDATIAGMGEADRPVGQRAFNADQEGRIGGESLAARSAETQNAWAPGANYVPLINDAAAPAASTVADLTKPITREEVLVPFMKALNIPIYEGRVTGKRLGYYMPKKETLRIKRKSDLEVAAHEIAHLIDDRVPEIGQAWKTGPMAKTFAEELRGVSYDAKNLKEGFAEFTRLYLTQPEQARAKAPEFSKWFDAFAAKHEYGPAIRQAQDGMTAWFGQDAINRARSKIGERRPINEALNGVWDRFRQATVDDLHGIYKMERELKGGKLDPVGPYETARLTRASHSLTDGSIRHGYPVKNPDGSFAFAGKGLEEILKPVGNRLDDFLLYAVGKSAQELMGQKREHLFTPGEINAMVALETPEFRQAFREYQDWNRGVVDFAEAQGVVNPAARDMWQRQSYVPFYRVGQPGEWKGGKPGDWSGIKALTGGTDNLRDILGNMIGNAAMLIDKATKNEARAKVANMAMTVRGGGRFMQEIPKEARPVKINPALIAQAVMKALGVEKGTPQARRIVDDIMANPDAFEFFLHDKAPAGSNVVAVLEGGKPRYFEVADPLLMRALGSIDRQNQHWLVNWLGAPKRIGQASITLTPDFWVANIARDTLMGAVMSQSGFRPFLDSIKGMQARMTTDPVYKEFIANGGGMASIYLDEAKFRAKLEKFYTRQGVDYRTVLDTPEKLLGFIETLGDSFEMSTRLGEYKRAREAGEHPRHAAYLGREVSADFAMRGDSQALGLMYDTVMFLKPAMVSMDRLFRGFAHDKHKGATAIKAGTIALASAALYLVNRDDPRYDALPPWDRDANWHFFIGDQHFRYPKIWEIGAMASAAERMVERILEKNPEGLGKDFARIIKQTFNLNLMPQIVAPLYEQATNRNSFTGSPIETPGMEEVQPFLRAKPNTSETLRALGMATADNPEALQVNPARAEALLRGYFNTWAMYGLMLSDRAIFGKKLPEGRTDKMPVVRRFYSQEPAQHTRYEDEFYDMLGEAQRLRGTMRTLDKMGHSDMADRKEKSPMAGEAQPLERANKNLLAIAREARAVRQDDTLTPSQKREKLDALTAERNALLKATAKASEEARK